MVTLKEKQILINGKPQLILCGEIHYFRLPRTEWQDRIDKLKAAGMNAVASYIPWLCHEEEEGSFDFGEKRPELNLAEFIELCQKNDLYFIARPGPFIMAEMKNEGIPFWVAENYPEVVPVTWDGAEVTTKTLDYLSEPFLACVKRWYEKVCSVLAPYLEPAGGKLIAFQLDNEMGMLSWVSNSPDLTELVMKDMTEWLRKKYGEEGIKKRYPVLTENNTKESCGKEFFGKEFFGKEFFGKEFFQSPSEETSLCFHQDLGNYMRDRICRYTQILKEYAEEFGIQGILFLINIHGTGGGRGLTYPVGISQLYRAYTELDGMLAGSDIYIGTLDMERFQDLYLINTYMEAVNLPDQPLASFEFECGDSNYGETGGGRNDVSASDLKTRMCIAQGNRLLNCYLFCGGFNYLLTRDYKDGNNRIASTGERHGFAAPVSPEGEFNYTYPRLKRVMKTMVASANVLARMQEARDGLAVGFLPDYFMTEFCYPGSEAAKKQRSALERFRAGNGFEVVTRALLLNQYSFSSVNVEEKEIPETIKTLVIYSAPYMSETAQKKLAEFAKTGGGLLLYGALPEYDMEGNPCTILKDFLEIEEIGEEVAGAYYYLSVEYLDYLSGPAEIRTGRAQTYRAAKATALLCTADNKKICGLERETGSGRVILIGTDLTCNLKIFRKLIERLGCTPALQQNCPEGGIVTIMTESEQGEQLLHVLNLDTFEKHAVITWRGETLFEGKQLRIPAGEGIMLPIHVNYDGIQVRYSTAELYEQKPDCLVLRLTQEEDVLVLEGTGIIREQEGYTVEEQENCTKIISRKNGKVEEFLELFLKKD